MVTKRLIVDGANGSGVTIDCNGATIDGSKVPELSEINAHKDMILVRSAGEGDVRSGTWQAPVDVTIKDCNVIGSIRLLGISNLGTDLDNLRESSYRVGHPRDVRRIAPRRITLDGLTVTGRARNTVYFGVGVSESKLVNSKLLGESIASALYLDSESQHNLIKNNEFHTRTAEEVMAVDGSSGNKIINNWFSGLSHGGIYLFRNCGERGVVRHDTPTANEIINNVFYYRDYNPLSPNPSVYLGADNGNHDFCWKDDGHSFGSSKSNLDYAQHNVVMQNQIFKLPWYKMIREARSTDRPNFIGYNTTVTTPISRPAGCFLVKTEVQDRDFIVDGESVNGLTCHDNVLTP